MNEQLTTAIPASGVSLPPASSGDTIVYLDGEWTSQPATNTNKNLRVITVNPDEPTTEDNFESIQSAILAATADYETYTDSLKLAGTAQGGEIAQIYLDPVNAADNGAYNNYIISFYEGPAAGLDAKIIDYNGESNVATMSVEFELSYDTSTKYYLFNYSVPHRKRIVISDGEYYENLIIDSDVHISAITKGGAIIHGNHTFIAGAMLENLVLTPADSSPVITTVNEWSSISVSSVITLRNCDINNGAPSTTTIRLPGSILHYGTSHEIGLEMYNCNILGQANLTALQIGYTDFGDSIFNVANHYIKLSNTVVNGSISLLSGAPNSINMIGGTLKGILYCYYGGPDLIDFNVATFADVNSWQYLDDEPAVIRFKGDYLATLDPPSIQQNLQIILRNVNFQQYAEFTPGMQNFISADEDLSGNSVKYYNVSIATNNPQPEEIYNTITTAVVAVEEPVIYQELECRTGSIPSFATKVGLYDGDTVNLLPGMYDGQRMTLIMRNSGEFTKALNGSFLDSAVLIFPTVGATLTIEWSKKDAAWAVLSMYRTYVD